MIFKGGGPVPSGTVNSWVVAAMSAVHSFLPASSNRMATSLPLDSILVGTGAQLELPHRVIEKDLPRSIHTGTGDTDKGGKLFKASGTPL